MIIKLERDFRRTHEVWILYRRWGLFGWKYVTDGGRLTIIYHIKAMLVQPIIIDLSHVQPADIEGLLPKAEEFQ